MKFLDTCCTGQSGSIHDRLEPRLKVRQSGQVLKATVGERGSVITLAGRQPADDARETVVVVVLGESCQSGFGVAEAGETLAVEDFRLEDVPKSLDLAIGPRRGDLGPQVLNVELPQSLAKEREHARHPDHEWLTVVAHELKRLAAEFKTFVQPAQDGPGLGLGQDAQANHKPPLVIPHPPHPGLEVAATEMDEERTLDIDVPELVRLATFVPRPGRPGHSAATTAAGAEEAGNVARSAFVHSPPRHFGRDPLQGPLAMEPDR